MRRGTSIAASNGEKKRLSGKMETGTAKIKTVQQLPSGEVVAEACLNHYGHDLDRRHLQSLRLPMLERDKLAGKIAAGVSLTRVLENVIQTCEDLSEDALSDCEGNEDFGDLNPDKPLFTSQKKFQKICHFPLTPPPSGESARGRARDEPPARISPNTS